MMMQMPSHAVEVKSGERFEFGANWRRFLDRLNEDRIATAEASLRRMLEVDSLAGKSFLDIGSGSGLFSLAARRLGARVHSLDYDPNSVGCTMELRRRYFPDSPDWTIEEGSALDPDYIRSLGLFDVVYSWGVLHHTGQMWKGLENAQMAVRPGGKLFVAIYNDTGTQSKRWLKIKQIYNKLPRALRPPYAAMMMMPEEAKVALRAVLDGKPGNYIRWWTEYSQRRGMSRWHDVVDWVGGLPYEFATPEEIFEFYKARGFTLTKMRCARVGLGCNEFVMLKSR